MLMTAGSWSEVDRPQSDFFKGPSRTPKGSLQPLKQIFPCFPEESDLVPLHIGLLAEGS